MIRRQLAVLLALLVATAAAADKPRIAIIIDDLGYEREISARILALPADITMAVLPDAPRAAKIATAARAVGKEVIVHLPLQAMNSDPAVEPGDITIDMDAEDLGLAVERALAAVPHAVGVNNHRGSLLTRHPGHMRWLMDSLRQARLRYFVDSYTTHHSIALEIAQEAGLPALRRDVFLDSERSPAGLEASLERLKARARQNGYAVGIGHPYPETADLLERALPELLAEGFELVHVSALIAAPLTEPAAAETL